MITTTLNRIRAHGPCREGWEKLLKELGKTAADDEPLPFARIVEINGLDDALWCCRAEPQHAREWRLFAVWCARQVQHLMKDERSIAALDVAERHANGQATDEELAAARDAAGEAAGAAAGDAAWAAARDAAGDAAGDAAWVAAEAAAWAARDAAGDAAEAAAEAAAWAAGDAAGDAAEAAAWAAAGDAAEAAAEAAARDAQKAEFLRVVNGGGQAMTDITIPPEALEAAVRAALEAEPHIRDQLRAACLAMLKAWPGTAVNDSCPVWHAYPHIILPLTENTND